MRSFKIQFELRQKEVEEMQTKLVPHMDNELLRIKLVNEIEGPHKAQLDLKQSEIEKLSNDNFTLKRHIDNIKNEYENYKQSTNKEIQDLKINNKNETYSIYNEISLLHEKIDEQTDKETIRKIKREKDIIYAKYSELLKETENLRRENNTLRNERQDNLWKYTKEIEEIKNLNRNNKHENDKLLNKLKNLEDEAIIYKSNLDALQNENEQATNENEK